ncbi:hypothetical protein [Nocardia callitridis]|uniref:hypothetical protein n=1 Tax=Nocardia callitridis TaxID=648753 RepID=UPI0031EAA081
MADSDPGRDGRSGGYNVPVRLRRCREPLAHTKLLYQDRASRSVAPLELEIAQDLPDVCSRHGRHAVSRKPIRMCFYDTKQHPRFPRMIVENWPTRQLSPMSTILVGSWPVCDRCGGSSRRLRQTAAALGVAMVLNLFTLIALLIAGRIGLDVHAAIRPMVWAFFPGSIPIGLCAVALLLRTGAEPVEFLPIDDERCAVVRADRRFGDAVLAMPGSTSADNT